jgi:hypothetical protein
MGEPDGSGDTGEKRQVNQGLTHEEKTTETMGVAPSVAGAHQQQRWEKMEVECAKTERSSCLDE